jgi:hypothetical protein
MMGMGVSGVTGDYSRGAAGFWIEFKAGSDSPTLRVDDLTVAWV